MTQLLLHSVAMVVQLVLTWCWVGWTILGHISSLSMHTGVLTNCPMSPWVGALSPLPLSLLLSIYC